MQPNTFYHIYNHANGKEDLFFEEENYYFFLRQWTTHIEPVATTYAYCLMPNHIHFLVKTREEKVLEQTFGKFETFQKLEYRLSKSFANLFSSYTQSFNKVYNRKGSLFIPNFRRKEIESEDYLTIIVHYIHHNPIHHGFCEHYEEWKFSSYHAYLTEKPSRLERDYILEWFGGRKEFLSFHEVNIELPETSIHIDM